MPDRASREGVLRGDPPCARRSGRAGWGYVWRYRVRPGREREFEALYGPDGGWVRLFARSPGYVGTHLLRGRERGHYVTLDLWTDEASHRALAASHPTEWEELDRLGQALTVEEVAVGEFDVVEGPASFL